jgi:hypothetical protein
LFIHKLQYCGSGGVYIRRARDSEDFKKPIHIYMGFSASVLQSERKKVEKFGDFCDQGLFRSAAALGPVFSGSGLRLFIFTIA